MSTAEIQTSFNNYVALVTTELSSEEPHADSSPELLEKVEHLETTNEFRNLMEATQKGFPVQGMWIVNLWSYELGNFFRRTGFYEDSYAGRESFGIKDLLEKYLACLKRTDCKVRYLAPIDAIDFGVTSLDLGEFSIRKFSIEEIDDLFENDRRKSLYPTSVIQSRNLSDYWCLDITVSASRPSLDTQMDWDFSPSFLKEISSFPSPVENALKKLVLFDWQSLQTVELPSNSTTKWEPGKGWCRFHVPAVLSVTDDLFSHPGSSVPIPPIDEEPRYLDESGEEEIWVPSYLRMTDDERIELTELLGRLNDLIPTVSSRKNWRFMDVALGFMVKAFFAEGLEQLLWHISVLESLLGENKEGLTELLARRVACITGKTRKERPAIKDAFAELYSFRSNLVHGNREILDENKIYVSHLRQARQIARETLMWFLNLLDIIEKRSAAKPCVSGLPKRTDLLTLIDMDGGRRTRLNWLINNLPSQFPNI